MNICVPKEVEFELSIIIMLIFIKEIIIKCQRESKTKSFFFNLEIFKVNVI